MVKLLRKLNYVVRKDGFHLKRGFNEVPFDIFSNQLRLNFPSDLKKMKLYIRELLALELQNGTFIRGK